jgi:predicted GTPase
MGIRAPMLIATHYFGWQFIQLLTDNPDVKISHGLESETNEVQSFRFVDRTSGRTVTIVDTPGFDDSREGRTDTDVLRHIADFLCKECVFFCAFHAFLLVLMILICLDKGTTRTAS